MSYNANWEDMADTQLKQNLMHIQKNQAYLRHKCKSYNYETVRKIPGIKSVWL